MYIYLGLLLCSFLVWMKAAVLRRLAIIDWPAERFETKEQMKAPQLGREPGLNGKSREVEIHQANWQCSADRTNTVPLMFAFMDPITLCE